MSLAGIGKLRSRCAEGGARPSRAAPQPSKPSRRAWSPRAHAHPSCSHAHAPSVAFLEKNRRSVSSPAFSQHVTEPHFRVAPRVPLCPHGISGALSPSGLPGETGVPAFPWALRPFNTELCVRRGLGLDTGGRGRGQGAPRPGRHRLAPDPHPVPGPPCQAPRTPSDSSLHCGFDAIWKMH